MISPTQALDIGYLQIRQLLLQATKCQEAGPFDVERQLNIDKVVSWPFLKEFQLWLRFLKLIVTQSTVIDKTNLHALVQGMWQVLLKCLHFTSDLKYWPFRKLLFEKCTELSTLILQLKEQGLHINLCQPIPYMTMAIRLENVTFFNKQGQ